MQVIQWIIAAGTAIFVALVGYFQWRTAHQKAALDLFDRCREIYEVIRKAAGQMAASSLGFDQGREIEFMDAMERAYFFFGDDVCKYVRQLWSDIVDVRCADDELPATNDPNARREVVAKRRAALTRIGQFHAVGQPLFAKYMRFSQTVNGTW